MAYRNKDRTFKSHFPSALLHLKKALCSTFNCFVAMLAKVLHNAGSISYYEVGLNKTPEAAVHKAFLQGKAGQEDARLM